MSWLWLYINPEKGEGGWENYIRPDTPFDKLLDSWVCPVCGAPKDMFEKAHKAAGIFVP